VVVSLQGLDPAAIHTGLLVPLKGLGASAGERVGRAVRLLRGHSPASIPLIHVHNPCLGSSERSRLRDNLELRDLPRQGHLQLRAMMLPGPGVEESIRTSFGHASPI